MESLAEKIRGLCRRKNAVILAHNYTLPEIQDMADVVGDSLELARRAASTDAEIIVLCGVHFMAETAKIINPQRTVLMPDTRAGCPMADMVTAEQLIEAKKKLPGCAVVCYVNTSAAVKAESDICCTSSNAPAVVSSLPPDQPILFVPDRNLGAWTAEKTGRKMTIWDGYCPTHERILPLFIERARTEHPHAVLVAHPECPASVRAVADHIASTAGILAFCRQANADEFIIATEEGILHRLAKENPGKKFYPASRNMNCPNMKRSTAERVLWCLEDLSGEITVDPETARRAKGCIDRMLALFPAATPKRQ